MSVNFEQVFEDVRSWASAQGIRISRKPLPPGKAGEFDGLSVTMNSGHEYEESTYYLAHALGSIVFWGLDGPAVQALFDELRAAKKGPDRNRLERAIERYRAFEMEPSELAVWLLAELGHSGVVPSYTNFMRADLEALTELHRSGRAPVWRHFFARWNEEVAAGRRQVLPFCPKPIPSFEPVPIQKQEVLQEQGDKR
jgi:hypothetical protein